jgi:Ser-tRNA(Ala) deacylase AlaX
METLALFNSEPYRRVFSAMVIAVVDNAVVLEHTLFYPTGGGQPGDTGHFTLADGTQIDVIGTVRDPLLPSII